MDGTDAAASPEQSVAGRLTRDKALPANSP